MIQALVDEGRELKEVLMGVVDPGLRGKSEDGGLAVDGDSNETSRFGSEESVKVERGRKTSGLRVEGREEK